MNFKFYKMKITVKHRGTTIIVDETETLTSDQKSSLKWKDQAKIVQETIIVMVKQCSLLKTDK